MEDVEKLKKLIYEKELELEMLKSQLQEAMELKITENPNNLTQFEVSRYSRQLIMPEIGVGGQLSLKKSSVLIVGAGGLGCPVGIYLAAAGVGKIGIVDYDIVEINNLHRQIAHGERNIGQSKCSSLKSSLRNINNDVQCLCYECLINKRNIEEIMMLYDIVVDCSDNVPTRYLLNDAAVLLNKPLVSGSALRFEGQLTIYNYNNGPCYRCIFPTPPPPESVTNCSDGGVIGAVTGVIGSLQALETIKIIVGVQPSYCKKILIYDGLEGDFKVIKLRGKNSNCLSCVQRAIDLNSTDYDHSFSCDANDKTQNITLLQKSERIMCSDYNTILKNGNEHVLLDVRPPTEFGICSLPDSVNIQYNRLKEDDSLEKLLNLVKEKSSEVNYVVCRRGNDSQRAVLYLKEKTKDMELKWLDIEGGLQAWHKEVDSSFPLY